MKNPLVSIVLCCHNRGHLLPQTMASVFAQNYNPIEIVVLDDGSTDNTSELMANYGDRIRYYWQENQGTAVARTTACGLARGEFVALQDDDDLMHPDRIVVLYEALRRYPAAVLAVGDWMVIDNDGNRTGERWLPKAGPFQDEPVLIKDGYMAVMWPKVAAVPHTTLFRKADGNRIGWFDNLYRNTSDDKDFFARLARLGPVVHVPKVVSYYRRGHESVTSNSIITPYNKLFLLENHLKSIEAERRELRKRLEFRVLIELKRIAFYRSIGLELPDRIPKDYLRRGLSLLGLRDRLAYGWYTFIKLPIRKLIRGCD